jgi:ssRNA-specific RNase YbeY (16S rRNA maturation enzyme)
LFIAERKLQNIEEIVLTVAALERSDVAQEAGEVEVTPELVKEQAKRRREDLVSLDALDLIHGIAFLAFLQSM